MVTSTGPSDSDSKDPTEFNSDLLAGKLRIDREGRKRSPYADGSYDKSMSYNNLSKTDTMSASPRGDEEDRIRIETFILRMYGQY